MWFPKLILRFPDSSLTLARLQDTLAQNFPAFEVTSRQAEGSTQGTIFIRKSPFNGVKLVFGGPASVVLLPYVPHELLAALWRGRSLFQAPFFCGSRHLRQIGRFLVEKFGDPVAQADSLAGPRRWTGRNVLLFVVSPLAGAMMLLSFIPDLRLPWNQLTATTGHAALIVLSVLLVSLTLLFLSNAMDDLPDILQLPVITPLISFLFYTAGVLGMLYAAVCFLGLAVAGLFPP